ncbi:substrate-binding periplasmic protein [Andreprevotia chitinilytica]|uniref:substrate-binding periplasmic protein n=1 Tax=Andreprevotia chitinilytica TaxID=396808 RepID=UPI0006921596|nr:transporter substrate-binding domain-containing protein [Andreprevotia chitinilytica]
MLIGVAPAQAAQHVVLYGDDNYAPYSYVENGQFKGIDVDFLQQAAALLKPGYEVELRPLPWKRGLASLANGSIFGLFPPGLKPERTWVSPYSVPLYRETDVLFCNKEVMKRKRTRFPEDFVGVVIGINSGFLLSARLMDAARAGKVKLEETKGNESNLKKLALKHIDCYASDRGAAYYTAAKLRTDPEAAKLKLKLIEAVELSGEETYIGYSINNNPPYKNDFVKKMNAAIEQLKRNGNMKAIVTSYYK